MKCVNISQFFKTVMRIFLASQIAFLNVSAQAAEIKIKKSYNVRIPVNGEQVMVGQLAKGSVIEVPDQYLELHKGKPNFELTLNKWLKEGGADEYAPGRFQYDGTKSGKFFPVKIKELAPGSQINNMDPSKPLYISLDYLKASGETIKLTANLPVHEVTAQVPVNAEMSQDQGKALQQNTKTEAGASSQSCVDCQNPNITKFLNDLKSAQTTVQNGGEVTHKGEKVYVAGVDVKTSYFNDALAIGKDGLTLLDRNIRASCPGHSLKTIRDIVKKETRGDDQLENLFMGIIVNETLGKCQSSSPEHDKSESVGIAQVNTESANIPVCQNISTSKTPKEIAKNKALCLTELRKPEVNIAQAVRIFKAAESSLFGPDGGFDRAQMSRADQLRIAISAYNGPATWVRDAKKGLEAFNKKFGTNLSHHRWEDLRLFYMRSFLSGSQRSHYLGESRAGRAQKFTVINMAYVETLVPRSGEGLRTLDGFMQL